MTSSPANILIPVGNFVKNVDLIYNSLNDHLLNIQQYLFLLAIYFFIMRHI